MHARSLHGNRENSRLANCRTGLVRAGKVRSRVERRAGAKENANQQSTRRAQNRESVSQALERVRNTARQKKKESLTTLLHHIDDPICSKQSFLALKRNAAAGASTG